MDLTQPVFRGKKKTENITSTPQVIPVFINGKLYKFACTKDKMSSPINPSAIKQRIGHNETTDNSKQPEDIHT